MITLRFVLNDQYVITSLVAGEKDRRVPYASKEWIDGLISFQDAACKKSETLYYAVLGSYRWVDLLPMLQTETYSDFGNTLSDYVNDLSLLDEYQILKKQTQESIMLCENEWKGDYERTIDFIKSLGIDIDAAFDIWMTHPTLKAGMYLGNNAIKWSYQTYWPHYNTVYLWHEILHSQFKLSKEIHALIELITDDEMRVRLNGGSYPPFEGHPDLHEIKEKMLPEWKKFLKQDKKDVHAFAQQFISRS